LNLTSILAELKKENRSLKNDQIAYKTKNEQLKEDNKVLLREIDRLKSLTEPQN
jgi:cell division protein FtsB